jgi:hypothetical protein
MFLQLSVSCVACSSRSSLERKHFDDISQKQNPLKFNIYFVFITMVLYT